MESQHSTGILPVGHMSHVAFRHATVSGGMDTEQEKSGRRNVEAPDGPWWLWLIDPFMNTLEKPARDDGQMRKNFLI